MSNITAVEISVQCGIKSPIQRQTESKAVPSTKTGSKRKFVHADEDAGPLANMIEDEFEFRRLARSPGKVARSDSTCNPEAIEFITLSDEDLVTGDNGNASRKILQPSEMSLMKLRERKHLTNTLQRAQIFPQYRQENV
jgi:hypothetical protein